MSENFHLVIGGATSGKSAFAEKIVSNSKFALNYIATARIFDDEMQDKVDAHKKMRGAGWRTFEEPFAPEQILAQLGPEDAVLLDCATMWLTNHMMEETDLAAAQAALLVGLNATQAFCVVVTNDVGGGIVPADALSRRFRTAQGELNQVLAANAGTVVQVVAGLPNVLKGSL